jgi:hypothetical protein
MEPTENKIGYARIGNKPPIRINDIDSAWSDSKRKLWMEDEENFMGEDYEPEFHDEKTKSQ